jgi:hypothetical protein
LAPEFRDLLNSDENFAKFPVFRGKGCRMPYFTQKTISVGIFAAVFLFFLVSLQQSSSSTFLPITWATGVRFRPSKDHFEAFFQGDPFLQSNLTFDSFQPARAADWPPDPWDLFGDFGILPPSTHAITPQNFSHPLGTPGRMDLMVLFQDLKHPWHFAPTILGLA